MLSTCLLKKDKILENFGDLNNTKGFKVVSINIRSLTSKIAQLEALLDSTKVDALCINGKHKVDAHKYEDLNKSNKNIEALVLEIQQKCTKPKILIITYRPPQGKPSEYIDELRDTLTGLNTGLELFLLGDLNINYSEKNLKAVKEMKVLEKEFNLKQQISYPTRVTTTTETLLDHIYTNSNNIVQKGLIESHLSDHYPVYLIVKKKPVTYECQF